MEPERPQSIYYKRSRFSTRLPTGRLYTPAHFWIAQDAPEVYRVGFTKFATRMRGDLVEYAFELKSGDPLAVGQAIGSVEGFKAVTELYSVIDGRFVEPNPQLEQDVTLTDTDPYGKGWLYRARGTPDRAATDVQGYVALLDATIDKMRENIGAPKVVNDDAEAEDDG
jgi:glycine cleavage system H protein